MRTQHSSKRKQKKFSGFPDPPVHSAARTFPNAIAQRPCSGATLVALPTAWNAAPAA